MKILIIICVVNMVSCSTFNQTKTHHLTEEEITEDLNYLKKLYVNAYAGANSLIYGNKLEAAINSIKASDIKTANSLVQAVIKVQSQFYDEHWSMTLNSESHRLQSSSPKSSNWKKLPKEFSFEENEIYFYVRVPIMPASLTNHHKNFLSQIMKVEKPIVFDLRQNPGGSDEFMFQVAPLLRPKSFKKKNFYKGLELNSVLAKEGYLRSVIELSKKMPNMGYQRVVAKLESELKILKTRSTSELKPKLTDFTNELVSKEEFNARKIAMLIDEKCASACELFIALFFNDPNVTIIGNRSSGRYLLGNPGTHYLPNSKIRVNIAQMANLFKVKNVETVGFEPHCKALNDDELDKCLVLWDKK